MELEVRVVAGIESCFVSLPLSFIRTLQSTYVGVLPPVVGLELHSRRTGECWHLAWSGSASRSSAIEVAQQLADCISLSDGTEVQVKATANLPKATIITVEPNTEDDWEILELNSELAEMAILKQVSIVCEGMRFPLWLHGHSFIVFRVVSISPRKSIVQLVPGTEVSVSPKRRKNSNLHQIHTGESSVEKHVTSKALLRVQTSTMEFIHKINFHGIELGTVPTSIAFIHQETAQKYLFDNHQFVSIFRRSSVSGSARIRKNDALRKQNALYAKEGNFEDSTSGRDASKHSIVFLLFSDSVARGHVMLTRPLCLYMRAEPHSWVHMKQHISPRKDIPLLTLSPSHFKHLKDTHFENQELDMIDSDENQRGETQLVASADKLNWPLHEMFLAAFSSSLPAEGVGSESVSNSPATNGKERLISAWLIGQLKAISSYAGGMEVKSMILSSQTLIHFEINGRQTKETTAFSELLETRNKDGQSVVQLFYVLSATFGDSSHDCSHDCYELAIPIGSSINDFRCLDLSLRKLELGEPVSFISSADKSDWGPRLKISSLGWMETAISDVTNRVTMMLSAECRRLSSIYGLPLPGHILIYGPPGSGKTSLAMSVSRYIEAQDDILAHIVFVHCSKLALEKAPTIRQTIVGKISEALDHAPALLVFDDLDIIVSSSSEPDASQLSSPVTALVQFLTDVIDEYGEKWRSCGVGPITFMATAHSLDKLPKSLSSSGRFDFHVQLPAPAAQERGAILKNEICKRSLQCSEDILADVASKCDGYDAYDLEILVDRAIHAAVSRFLPRHSALESHEKPALKKEDFAKALCDFIPVAMRGIPKSALESGHSGWEDVGGLSHVKNAIQEMVEYPSKFPKIFANAPLRLRSNVLLYGPPGCGKTHIVRATAAAFSLRIISVKGPELLNKYIGASEQAVRDVFTKAVAAAPCILFFDEFDSIAPKRGHDNTGVTDRVVNQLLTELDGVEALKGVFVFAATSRPDLLDNALLRPGRLDRLLFCDFPSWHERLDILTLLSRKLILARDVDMEVVATATEGFSGADLQALLSDAQLASVHELLESDAGEPRKMPVIGNGLLKTVASKAKPSVYEAEKRRLYSIYNQFLDSKKSVTDQSRDAKGKRATLA